MPQNLQNAFDRKLLEMYAPTTPTFDAPGLDMVTTATGISLMQNQLAANINNSFDQMCRDVIEGKKR